MRTLVRLVAAGAMITTATVPVLGQKMSPGDLAQRISGTWLLDWDLTRSLAGGRGGRGRGGVVPVALLQQRGAPNPYPQGVRANPTNTEPTSSKPSDLTPAELTERKALWQLEQVQPTINIAASADQVTIADERGDSSCDLNGKTGKVRLFGMNMDVKCKWDKDQLRQEFSTARTKVIRVWSLDASGHLLLTLKREGIDQDSPETTTVYDRS